MSRFIPKRRESSFSNKLSIDTTKVEEQNLPIIKTPGWRVEFDSVLGFKYINDSTGQIQYDNPDEVMISPTDNLQDHRKVFSTKLKRSLSPRFFNNASSRSPSPSPVSNSPDELRPKVKKRSSSLFGLKHKEKEVDDDEEEFKKQLEKEMLDYENQRINKN